MKRVAHGPVEGRSRLETGLSSAFAEATGLFEPIELEGEAVDEGWLPTPSSEMKSIFIERAGETLDELGLSTDVRADLDESAEFVASSSGDLIASPNGGDARPARSSGLGGRSGEHTADFDQLWGEMTKTYREHPGATW